MNDKFTITSEILNIITPDQAWYYRVIPYTSEGGTLGCLYDREHSPGGALMADELEIILGRPVQLDPDSPEIIEQLLSTYYRRSSPTKAPARVLNVNADSDFFLADLIEDARQLKSSDIHIETYEDRCRVRIRIDGMMVERHLLSKLEYPALINKIKISANLDIAEKRLPQDGRIFFNAGSDKFDIRVSILPTLHGEKIVLRLLSNDATAIDIYKLGFSDTDLAHYLEGIKRPNGMMLISGPTGSGKTTTLYATLKVLNKETRNILTIEDPIEYTLEGINQVQLKENIGFNFASALRTFLRQDPDIIMVGEIRDPETASMAIRASLTGHLVLSTIHTNSAWGIIARLIDMGIPPFLLANTLNTAVAQRLVRILCTACRKPVPFDAKLYPKQFKPLRAIDLHYVPVGCEHCHFTGYSGRKAIYEVIPVDAALSEAIKNNVHQVDELLKERNVCLLSENAFGLFEQGETSLEDIYSLLVHY